MEPSFAALVLELESKRNIKVIYGMVCSLNFPERNELVMNSIDY